MRFLRKKLLSLSNSFILMKSVKHSKMTTINRNPHSRANQAFLGSISKKYRFSKTNIIVRIKPLFISSKTAGGQMTPSTFENVLDDSKLIYYLIFVLSNVAEYFYVSLNCQNFLKISDHCRLNWRFPKSQYKNKLSLTENLYFLSNLI